nr:hypothetical protein [Tanacetum cinerariifolium]
MATTIEQQVAMDEALVPSTQRDLYAGILGYSHNKKHIVNSESFRDMLHISPRILGQSFDELPFEEEILEFIRFLEHSATIRRLTDVNINKLYQPWRSFAVIINKCLTGKSSGYDSFWLSQAQILWGLYHKRNIDYAFLIWEDFVYQVEHKNHKKSNEMYYPRFIKVIIHHFMLKDPSILRRNKINWHYVRDDSIFSTIKVVSRHQNTQQYGAMLPIELTNDEIRNSKAYKEYYAFATGEAVPKPKASARRKKSDSDTSITPPTATPTPKPTVAVTPRLTAAAKGKQTAKSLSAPSERAMTEAQQLKIVLRRSRQQTHISQPGGSGIDEGTGSKPGVPDVPTDESEEKLSCNSSDDEGADDQVKDGDDDEGDEGDESNKGEEDADEDKDGSEDEGDGGEDQGLNVNEEEHVEEEEEDELYRDVNINQGKGLQATLEVEDTHVTLTLINSDGQQESSSVSSQFVTSMLNPTSDVGMESIFATASSSVAPLHTSTPIMTQPTIATITTISQAQFLQCQFRAKQTNPFVEAVSNILGIVHQYMNQQINEAVRVAVQIQTDWLRDSYQRENDEFLRTIDENIKRIIKEQVKGQVKEQVSKILPRIEQFVNAQLEAEVLTRSSHSSRTSYAVVADLSEMELKKILIKKMEGNKRDDDKDEEPSAGSDRGSKRRREGKEPESASAPLETATRSAGRSTTGSKSRQASASESAFAEEPVQTTSQIKEPSHPVFETGAEDQPIVQSSQHPEWFSQPKKPPTSDRDWNKTLPAVQGSTQTWISELAKQSDSRSSFNELLDTPLDFSNFIMNRLKVDTLTPELLAGPTFELMEGSCTSLIELEYHLEEVYKATTDQLDWVNPEGQQCPHNLLQPLSLIQDNRGRRVIPFAHFINNDLEYLQGFYGFAVNRESALDVYSKRRIIVVTDLKIVEWHSYKHLDWISVRRDDDKIYKFKEGYFKRLRLQDIEDMLLLLVQVKLSNLTVEERFAFNVSFRMFTRSVVIQRRVEDLQLGVESYQKRLNLTKPDTYRSDLKRKEAYTAYSNPRGFIYQNKDKKNRLMRIDELHKFSDETLNDVRTTLDDRLKGIRMQYLPQTIWRKGDKDRAAAMIQAIDKMLKTMRIMRSLEKFIGGRLETVTHRFTLIVLSALRRSDNENMLSLIKLILRSILMDLQETLKRKWRYLIPADSQIHSHMLIPDYQDIIFQDFRYFDEFECCQVIKIG